MKKLIPSLILTIGVGVLASYVTSGETSGEWYTSLEKPPFNPPNWVFAPVWSVLYLLMGVSLFYVWKKPLTRERNIAITLFLAQLMFNFLWSVLFFSFHMTGFALIDMVALWITILLTIYSFSRMSKTAAWLLVPYIVWVSFALVLNWDIWMRN